MLTTLWLMKAQDTEKDWLRVGVPSSRKSTQEYLTSNWSTTLHSICGVESNW